MSDFVRLGIIGAGSIALRSHFPHLTMDDVRDRVHITAVCDPVLERAQAAAAKYGVPHAFATAEELLAANIVDAVSICSPIGVHYEQGMQAVEHGVHIHFNKTMTTTVDEADRLIAAAAGQGGQAGRLARRDAAPPPPEDQATGRRRARWAGSPGRRRARPSAPTTRTSPGCAPATIR